MRAIEVQKAGVEGLQIVERPVPKPGPGEVLIKLRAASVNFRDLGVVMGKYPSVFPIVPLSDGVGDIIEVGAGVTTLKPGQRVCPTFAPGWVSGPPLEAVMKRALGGGVTDGVLREYMVAGAQEVVVAPEHLTDEEAATLPCAAMTAWSALFEVGSAKPGDIVLIEGTGGVALFALQFARMLGARVALVSSSDEKLARAKQMGAEFLVNYKSTPQWGAAIREQTGGVGADIVVEVGGAATLEQALTALKYGGHISQVGLLSGVQAQLPLQLFVPKAARIQAVLTGSRTGFEAMNRAISQHKLRPVIERVAPFEEAAQAIKAMMESTHFGKVTIRIAA